MIKNTTGLKGIRKRSKGKLKYWARICVNGKQKTIGFFNTAEEAHTAYLCAILEHRKPRYEYSK